MKKSIRGSIKLTKGMFCLILSVQSLVKNDLTSKQEVCLFMNSIGRTAIVSVSFHGKCDYKMFLTLLIKYYISSLK